MINAKSIFQLISLQQGSLSSLVAEYGRKSVFPERLNRICAEGSERGVILLALATDCLSSIESVFFSLARTRNVDRDSLVRFLRPVARLFARLRPHAYSSYSKLQESHCEDFLKTHYVDTSVFGGANRRTNWSGYQLVENASKASKSGNHLLCYKEMLEELITPLLARDEQIGDILELKGIWFGLNANSNCLSAEPKFSHLEVFSTTDFRTSALLFDVQSEKGVPRVKLNLSHLAFSSGRAMELMLKAWAEMEATAWDRRNQILEDIRSDWGRVARGLCLGDLVGREA